MSNYENERDMWGDIVSADRDDRRISGRMIRKVGHHPGVANVSGGEQSASPSEMPRSRGGDFGKGPALQKNRSGKGYHVKGAPGFEDD